MGLTGEFRFVPRATLVTLRDRYTDCLMAIGLNQTYQIAGRAFTRANLADVARILGEINFAIAEIDGTRVDSTVADLSTL